MDLSQAELPITSFFGRIPGSKVDKTKNKENRQPIGKRKRDVEDSGTKPKGKCVKPIANKTPLGRATPKKLKHVYGSRKSSMSTGKQPMQVDIKSALRASKHAGSSSPDETSLGRSNDVGPSKRRRVHTELPLSRNPPRNVVQAFPTPPPTVHPKDYSYQSELSTLSSKPARRRVSAATPLPTPSTSAPRPKGHTRTSALNETPPRRAYMSPLTSRKSIADVTSSPLSSPPSDNRMSYDINVGEKSYHGYSVAQALREAAPDRRDASGSHDNTVGEDDPFIVASESFVPSSQTLDISAHILSKAASSAAEDEILRKTSPIFAIPSALDTSTMPPPLCIDTSSRRSVVESSQSQLLLPYADSPRRKKHSSESIIASSQSQLLLPFADSPRRKRPFFPFPSEKSIGMESEQDNQIVPSSQSQIESELSISMGASQLGLFSVAEPLSTISRNHLSNPEVDCTIAPQWIPTTPTTPTTRRTNSPLPVFEDPLQSPTKHATENIDVSDENLSSPARRDHPGDVTIRLKPRNSQSRGPSQESRAALLDDSATESESESVIANFMADIKKKKRVSPQPRMSRSPREIAGQNSFSSNESSPASPAYKYMPLSSPRNQSFALPSQASTEDTQALYIAGAPLSAPDFSSQMPETDESTQSMPAFVKDFIDMFDDDGSYPSHIPLELRD